LQTVRVEIDDAIVRDTAVNFEIDQPANSLIDSFRVFNVGKIAVAGDVSVQLGTADDDDAFVTAANCELIDNTNDAGTEIAARSMTTAAAISSGATAYVTDQTALKGKVNVADAEVTITGDNTLYVDVTFRICE